MLRAARRLLRRKERQIARRFLAEGPQAISEALRTAKHRHRVDRGRGQRRTGTAICSKSRPASGSASLSRQLGPIAELAETVTPQGLVAVCQMIDVPADEALNATPRLIVLCDQVRDPGNLGTVIRCADAFGADAVLISRDSVDLYNAKTVRATTGSLFHLPHRCWGRSCRRGRAGPRRRACRSSAPTQLQRCTVNDLAAVR